MTHFRSWLAVGALTLALATGLMASEHKGVAQKKTCPCKAAATASEKTVAQCCAPAVVGVAATKCTGCCSQCSGCKASGCCAGTCTKTTAGTCEVCEIKEVSAAAGCCETCKKNSQKDCCCKSCTNKACAASCCKDCPACSSNKTVVRVYAVAGLMQKCGNCDLAGGRLTQVVQNAIEPASWSGMGGPAHVSYFPGAQCLIIRQTPAAHAQVAQLLEALDHAACQNRPQQIGFQVALPAPCCPEGVCLGYRLESASLPAAVTGPICAPPCPTAVPCPQGFMQSAVPVPPVFPMEVPTAATVPACPKCCTSAVSAVTVSPSTPCGLRVEPVKTQHACGKCEQHLMVTGAGSTLECDHFVMMVPGCKRIEVSLASNADKHTIVQAVARSCTPARVTIKCGGLEATANGVMQLSTKRFQLLGNVVVSQRVNIVKSTSLSNNVMNVSYNVMQDCDGLTLGVHDGELQVEGAGRNALQAPSTSSATQHVDPLANMVWCSLFGSW